MSMQHEQIPPEVFSNPICKETFDSLPKIYGKSKKRASFNRKPLGPPIDSVTLKQVALNGTHFLTENESDHSDKHNRNPAQQHLDKLKMGRMKQKERKPLHNGRLSLPKEQVRFEDKYHKFGDDLRRSAGKSIEKGELTNLDRQSLHKVASTVEPKQLFPNDGYLLRLVRQAKMEVSPNRNPSSKIQRRYETNQDIEEESEEYEREDMKRQNPITNSISIPNSRSRNEGESLLPVKFVRKHERAKTLGVSKQQIFERGKSPTGSKEQLTQFSKLIQKQLGSTSVLKDQTRDQFKVPQKEHFRRFLQEYHPLTPSFKISVLLQKPKFQIICFTDSVYFGEVEKDMKQGIGLLVTESQIFEGIFDNDIKIKGYQKNIDGVYIGSYSNGLREGVGKFEWNNGEIFEGMWKMGTKNGFGVWQSPKGDRYEGNWRLNRQNGVGTFKTKLSLYKGQFCNFLKHGKGEEKFVNGDTFVGDYFEGKPHGRGRYQWKDRSVYEGDFVNGYREGRGFLKERDGRIYRAQAISRKTQSTVMAKRLRNRERSMKGNFWKAPELSRQINEVDELNVVYFLDSFN